MSSPTTCIAGLGCRQRTPASDVLAAIDAALAAHGLARRDLGALATITRKQHEHAMVEAAQILGLPLLIVSDADALAAQSRCLTHSAASIAATGLASVAEAAALAAAGPLVRLNQPRSAYGNATCALAASISRPEPQS